MNLLAAAFKLSTYQVWNRKRRWVTVGLLLFPVLIVIGSAIVGNVEKAQFYEGFITIALGTMLIPYLALFWGTGALTDEIEGKTLVYLWTRPRHRGLLIFLKLIFTCIWMIVFAAIGIVAAYIYSYAGGSEGGLTANLAIMFWDLRALTLSAFAYASLGFLLSVFTKRPLAYGLLIAYLWELIPTYGPGFFKRLSITQQTLALVTHQEAEDTGIAKKLISQATITEGQALVTLVLIIVVCCSLSVVTVGQKEFLSDDPARNQ